ncbi:unnamed protein product [Caenorhabditis brenneri]
MDGQQLSRDCENQLPPVEPLPAIVNERSDVPVALQQDDVSVERFEKLWKELAQTEKFVLYARKELTRFKNFCKEEYAQRRADYTNQEFNKLTELILKKEPFLLSDHSHDEVFRKDDLPLNQVSSATQSKNQQSVTKAEEFVPENTAQLSISKAEKSIQTTRTNTTSVFRKSRTAPPMQKRLYSDWLPTPPRGKAGYAVHEPEKFLRGKKKTEHESSTTEPVVPLDNKTVQENQTLSVGQGASISSKKKERKRPRQSKEEPTPPGCFQPHYYQYPLYYIPMCMPQQIQLRDVMIPASSYESFLAFSDFQFNPDASEFIPNAPSHDPLPRLIDTLIGDWECIRHISLIKTYLFHNRNYIRGLLKAPLKYSFSAINDEESVPSLTLTENGRKTRLDTSDKGLFMTPDGEMIVSVRDFGKNVVETCETYLRRDESDGTIQLVLHNKMRGKEMFRYYRKVHYPLIFN